MNETNNNPTYPENEPLRYFVPGELIVAVEHPEEFSQDVFVNDLISLLENGDTASLLLTELQRLGISKEEEDIVRAAKDDAARYYSRNRARVRTVLDESKPFVGGRGTSFVRLKLENIDDEALIYLAGELELRANPPEEETQGVVGMSLAKPQEGEQKVVGVSLNWLWSSAPDNTTVGGPGSLPVSPEPCSPDEEDDYEFGVWEPDFKPDVVNPNPTVQPGKPDRKALENRLDPERQDFCPSEVAILDTIPLPETLDAWAEPEEHDKPDNGYLKRLIEHLKSNSGSLHYYEGSSRSEDAVFNETDHPYHSKGSRYNMSDHGLFIAGIIHKIAPQAKIHMIEVLNEYAVGSSAALIWGLQQIIDCCKRDTWLIINSSLTISFSCDAIRVVVEEKQRPDPTPIEEFLCLLEHLDRSSVEFSLSSPIEKKYDEVKNSFLSAISVAAAGNDNPAEIDGQPPPPSRVMARFPAAYGSVIGVGALTREGEIARYSNKPDDPEPEGFYVFGGNVDGKNADDKWIASKTDGILGVYTYKTYPKVEMNTSPEGETGTSSEGETNTSGWARWAGTSFASAVATGILAQICQKGAIPLTDPEAIIKLLRDVAEEKVIGGHVIPVGQGKRGRNPDKETISPDSTS